MKKFSLLLATLALSSAAHAYTETRTRIYCDGASASAAIDTEDTVHVKLGAKSVDFKSKGKRGRDGIGTYADKASGLTLEVELPGPYDGVQDALWGQITNKAGKKKGLTCYIGDA